uniref:Uncharacterized protein n=1 Tax=Meloidogyne enterolobii TaxID=390850 RepID=A0A6V7UE93_MELEN|nr:unnamed protein product [Meloidogyne enterolobii]
MQFASLRETALQTTHADLIDNPQVEIGNEYKHILDYLHQQIYSFGIAEFYETAGSFAIFEYLKIGKTFNVFPGIIPPTFLQFFGINLVKQIREGHTVIPVVNSSVNQNSINKQNRSSRGFV